MKKTTLKEKIKKAFSLFSDTDNLPTEQNLEFVNETFLGKNEEKREFPREVNLAFKVFRQVFLFFPGVFLLNFLSGALTYFWLVESSLSLKPITISVLLVASFSILMTICGIGDIRKSKYLLIPGSIILVGTIAGFLAYLFAEPNAFRVVEKFIFSFMPLALTIPFLAKFLVDKKND